MATEDTMAVNPNIVIKSGGDCESQKFSSEIERLKTQVYSIGNRYKQDTVTTGKNNTKPY